MQAFRGMVTILGIAMIMVGLLWVGQGLDIIRWPASSFMLGQLVWTRNGAILAAVGAVLVWLARKR